ncbi:mannan endo-1,4-beta-mannosidase [Flexivirga endophytica]|uniref:Mannan endo-1,4-beta-mannosidase n=1 Tax=Flexivirga endophytica TaxID=1849103 RepID=A0A916SVH9_9MICO|nr:cellulase family glycosylhydrolase [Flexivirga endophytica]GGB15858.1 mannan endo-1,4-beta-mannosidase [Flexivirga endophytica]GHB39734.1 mannan endo-1,4-beta-mannosidase [Flexivirga endophytica]
MREGVERPLRFVPDSGAGRVWFGSNFWSRGGGPFMWQSYDETLVREELATMRGAGLDVTRSFLFWPHAMPEPGRLDPEVMDRYARFLDLHEELGMHTIPTFLVGHMSGENWDPSWRGDRDLYTDTWMVAQQSSYLSQVAARFATHPAVVGWLVSNEMPIYGGPAKRADVTAWAQLMVTAIRAGDPVKPVSIGDGAWGQEVTGKENGFSVRDLAELTDFVGPHVYPMGDDVVRQHLRSAFVCELASVAGLPVVLEEFGVSSDFASDAHAEQYYRQVLHTTLLAGATGWLAWNNTDFDNLPEQDPYRHHPFELHFGLTRVDGSPKPQLDEITAFRAVVDELDLPHCTRWPAQVALLVSSYLDAPEHWTFEESERTDIAAALEQAYVACREAGLGPAFVREQELLPTEARLMIVPSVKALTVPTWYDLADHALAGGTVYVSYGLGDSPTQRGPWWTGLEPTFGVRHTLRYGMVEPVRDDVVEVRVLAEFGSLTAGETLRFDAVGSPGGRSILPVEVLDADIIAVDQHDRPVLTRKWHGSGQAVLCTLPVEYFAANAPRVNPEDTWRLYDALAVAAGVERPINVADPRVLTDGLTHRDGREFGWLINLSDDTVEVDTYGVEQLSPYEVAVVQLPDTPFALSSTSAADYRQTQRITPKGETP